MSNQSNEKCPRCGVGYDTDGDGDCQFCHKNYDADFRQLRTLVSELNEKTEIKLLLDNSIVAMIESYGRARNVTNLAEIIKGMVMTPPGRLYFNSTR
jgi:hypothetical protein